MSAAVRCRAASVSIAGSRASRTTMASATVDASSRTVSNVCRKRTTGFAAATNSPPPRPGRISNASPVTKEAHGFAHSGSRVPTLVTEVIHRPERVSAASPRVAILRSIVAASDSARVCVAWITTEPF